MKKAIYPGSFDPVTYGHLDIVKRSASIFDEVVIAVLNNNEKSPLFLAEERVNMLIEAVKDFPNVFVESFSGLLVDFAKEKEVSVIVRGLRAVTDFEYELQIAQANRKISGEGLDTVFLTTALEYAYLSSSIVKEYAYYGVCIDELVPGFIIPLLKDKVKDGKA